MGICPLLNVSADGRPIPSIGPTIGSHSGPGTAALFFWGNPKTG